jgi:hypothetical protein
MVVSAAAAAAAAVAEVVVEVVVVVISHTNARVRLNHQPYKILNLVRSDSIRRGRA